MGLRLWAVRHAPTESAGLCVGRHRVPVTVPAKEAARQVLEQAPVRPRAVHCSPAPRCRDLARELASQWEVPCHVDPRLHEIDMGVFSGRTWTALETEAPIELDRWMTHWKQEGPPGGEGAEAVERRVRAWLAERTEAADELLLAHAGVVRALHVIVRQSPWDQAMQTPVPHLEWLGPF